ncbi:MAG: heat-inducible transcription repressor HrcA [Candidatus Tectomicrobia bacterium]|uniref:Heat-inducible transcription repressor HrcA n=1 Tax=Tectimicrobiota bacterium TaxID=2528274 RepID=A0A932FXN6_UNCTE|nr:heat-inducible transcription repressor HrcA [Candidatus Tectomicrobia bacterium]
MGERYRTILLAIIHSYIATGEPVGSRTLSKWYDLKVSPATIRNAMADLEDLGLLSQPHTSAGRVPTDQAYRIYVDNLFEIPPLSWEESQRIDQDLRKSLTELDHVMEAASKMLSTISKQLGMVFLPKLSSLVFKRIQFIKIRPAQALAILVADSGLVHNKIIEVEEEISQERLEAISRYLNEEFAGLSLRNIRDKLHSLMLQEKEEYDQLLQEAMLLGEKTFEQEELHSEIYVGGAVNILDQPEFTSNLQKMKAILRAFEEKSDLVRILDRCLGEESVTVLIGAESRMEGLEDFSIVAHTYHCGERAIGTLGILGPKRMEYPRVIAIVDYMAKAVSRILTGETG